MQWVLTKHLTNCSFKITNFDLMVLYGPNSQVLRYFSPHYSSSDQQTNTEILRETLIDKEFIYQKTIFKKLEKVIASQKLGPVKCHSI